MEKQEMNIKSEILTCLQIWKSVWRLLGYSWNFCYGLNSKSHGVLIVKVRGTRFALGRNITKNILVAA